MRIDNVKGLKKTDDIFNAGGKYAALPAGDVIRETAKAILYEIRDRRAWLPKSQIVLENNCFLTLYLKSWLFWKEKAREFGLL